MTDPEHEAAWLPKVSAIVEWENALFADANRPMAMLRELRRQAADMTREQDVRPFELLVVYDAGEFAAAPLAELLERCLGRSDEVITWRLLPAEVTGYYASKDLGARHAAGEILLFIDSDVIPEPRWLERLLAPFRDPLVQIVAGSAFIEPVDFTGKVFALTWFFPLRREAGPAEKADHFFANNFAMRKSLYDQHPFPELKGSSRGSCLLLAAELTRAGIPIFRVSGARVAHPAPNGAEHFIKRALAQGRDDVVRDRGRGAGALRSWLHSLVRPPLRCVQSTWKICFRFRRVRLNPVLIPAALLLAWSYYILCWAGELMSQCGLRYIRELRV
jgi:hypothetical protein